MSDIIRTMTLFVVLGLAWLPFLCSSSTSSKTEKGNNYVENACSVTLYPNLCVHSLASFSNMAKNNPSKWARAGVSVTIGEVKNITRYLTKIKKRNSMHGRSKIALSDCIECLQDALDSLHLSLGVLRKLDSQTFDTQMGDVTTWLSAALSDEDTCLDGFDDHQKSKQVKMLCKRVLNVTHITSIALALVNKLATTGP